MKNYVSDLDQAKTEIVERTEERKRKLSENNIAIYNPEPVFPVEGKSMFIGRPTFPEEHWSEFTRKSRQMAKERVEWEARYHAQQVINKAISNLYNPKRSSGVLFLTYNR